ncbi:MAG TPA: diguanylate cyclase [bacterium]|nr:diguanylate cyclase [bacterium]HMY34534.1 diguanylate cyclase [bacterium]HMZ03806.1 diguanylate cyclase [bacterium]HNB07952.1 diguanylate cyclase [bacterium]HNC49344.1 diguanylate cyclase [bacterium]
MKKILYIEDDPVAMTYMTQLIQRMGHTIITATTGESGLAKAFAERPDLILIDLLLPGLDGFELTIKMRSSETLKHTPIIATTATPNEDDQQLATMAGCDGFLVKPIEYEALSDLIRGCFDSETHTNKNVSLESENIELRRFTLRLVHRLTDKINEISYANKELQKTNNTLDRLIQEVRTNNADLMQINQLTSQIMAYRDRSTIYREMPQLISDQLSLAGAAIYVVNEKDLTLDVFSSYKYDFLPETEHIPFTEPPFFETVYDNQSVTIDVHKLIALQRENERHARRLEVLFESFHAQTVCFVPIRGRARAADDFECENQDCEAFVKKDGQWWRNLIHQYNRRDLDYPSRLRDASRYFFNCCFYDLKGVLALGIPDGRMSDAFRQIIHSFTTTVGLRLDNVQLYEDVREAYMLAEKQAITDAMTDVFNYRYFHHQLEREIRRAKRHWSKLSMIMIDVDHFKSYNDRHGHPAGDEILKRLAVVFKNITRTSDIIARYGGEEFVIVLPETPKVAAVKFAEKLRAAIQDEDFPYEQTQPMGDITVSMGVATFPDEAQTIDELIQRADEQLYRAKSGGRNRVAYSNTTG